MAARLDGTAHRQASKFDRQGLLTDDDNKIFAKEKIANVLVANQVEIATMARCGPNLIRPVAGRGAGVGEAGGLDGTKASPSAD